MVQVVIVGQGIAGSVLALQLLRHNVSVLILNNRIGNIASTAAAGIYNPVTGRHMVKSWYAEELFPYLHTFYQSIEKTLGVNFFHPLPLFRPFLTEQERAAWSLKHPSSSVNTDFASCITHTSSILKAAYQGFGSLEVKQAGYVDVPKFLHAVRIYFKYLGIYRETIFKYKDLRLGRWVQYENITAQYIIFCEGPQVAYNPFFRLLPFRLVKGELLSGSLAPPRKAIYNRGVFILPHHANRTLVGATYARGDLSLRPTSKARELIEARLHKIFNVKYTVKAQRVGIRPATFDRKPFVGMHTHHPQVGIFNGLGSKGISLAPYLARLLVDHLMEGKILPKSIQPQRIQNNP